MSRRNSRNFTGLPIRPNRKTLQLAGQIKEALNWVLGEASGDESLALCYIDEVEPLPGGNRMLVKVTVPDDIPLEDITRRLHVASSPLRIEVGAAITRRKVPELVYLPLRAEKN